MTAVRLRMLATVLFVLMCLALLAACSGNYSNPGSGGTPGSTPTSGY